MPFFSTSSQSRHVTRSPLCFHNPSRHANAPLYSISRSRHVTHMLLLSSSRFPLTTKAHRRNCLYQALGWCLGVQPFFFLLKSIAVFGFLVRSWRSADRPRSHLRASLRFQSQCQEHRETHVSRVGHGVDTWDGGTYLVCIQQNHTKHDTVSERLRRWTRNPLGSARRGSNPLGVAIVICRRIRATFFESELCNEQLDRENTRSEARKAGCAPVA